VHKNYLYVFSGRGCEAGFCSDVYRAQFSVGGQLNFAYVGDLPRPGREAGLALSFQGRLYDIGGRSNSGLFADIIMLDENDIWRAIEISEPTCNERTGNCFWNTDNVGAWPNHQNNAIEYRVVGTSHLEAIYIFGGKVSTNILQLKHAGENNLAMTLQRLGTVGNSGQIKRAYALSFLSVLWVATGLEDNGGGSNDLFYMRESSGEFSRQTESNFFDGRLHGGVIFLSRLCVLMGDNIGSASRWKVMCSVKPPFPQAQIDYESENVATTSTDPVLRDPASLSFAHAIVPAQTSYTVKYYAGAYQPDHSQFPNYHISKTVTLPPNSPCLTEFLFTRNPLHPTALYVRVTLEFDADQAFVTTYKDVVWTIKQTLSQPTATSPFDKKESESGNTFQHRTISCTPSQCNSGCQVAYRYSSAQTGM
jgi:hypothetical protein